MWPPCTAHQPCPLHPIPIVLPGTQAAWAHTLPPALHSCAQPTVPSLAFPLHALSEVQGVAEIAQCSHARQRCSWMHSPPWPASPSLIVPGPSLMLRRSAAAICSASAVAAASSALRSTSNSSWARSRRPCRLAASSACRVLYAATRRLRGADSGQ